MWVRRMTCIFLKWKSGFFALLSYVTWSIDSWPWLCVGSTWGTSGELRVQHRTPGGVMLNTLYRWCTGLEPTEFTAAFLCPFRLCLNVHFHRAHGSRKALRKPGFYLSLTTDQLWTGLSVVLMIFCHQALQMPRWLPASKQLWNGALFLV